MTKTTAGTAVAIAPTNTGTGKNHISAEAIAIRAHEIYRERGGTDGHDLDDWLQAESELSNKNT